MQKFVYTITKRTHNRNGHGYIYITVHEIQIPADDETCPMYEISKFKVQSGSNISSEVMNHLAKIGKIDKEYISEKYNYPKRIQFPFRIWEI